MSGTEGKGHCDAKERLIIHHTASRTFAAHHRPRLKSVVTCTLEPTDDISARAVATRISNVTLIGVCVGEQQKKNKTPVKEEERVEVKL